MDASGYSIAPSHGDAAHGFAPVSRRQRNAQSPTRAPCQPPLSRAQAGPGPCAVAPPPVRAVSPQPDRPPGAVDPAAMASPVDDAAFQASLLAEIPALRRRARTLTMNDHGAQDLVQDTLLKAWAGRHGFRPGSSLRAWLFTIQRNTFYSDLRKARWEVEDTEGRHAATLIEPGTQEDACALREAFGAVALLPRTQRDALILIGVEGYSYDEVAVRTACSIGTVKSRVSRARRDLRDRCAVADPVRRERVGT